MSESTEVALASGNPYKIVDYTREKRKGITASSLEELTNVARCRLALSADADLTIVLEQDGKINTNDISLKTNRLIYFIFSLN